MEQPMMAKLRAITLAGVAALLLTCAVGCESGFVIRAFRDSSANFLTNVFTTAVNESIASN